MCLNLKTWKGLSNAWLLFSDLGHEFKIGQTGRKGSQEVVGGVNVKRTKYACLYIFCRVERGAQSILLMEIEYLGPSSMAWWMKSSP